MPLNVPVIDNRKYEEILDEALARIPTHNPEWTNFNKSDPGVTLIEVFSFIADSLLYRSNLIPERNRKKFLTLLGVPLQPASSARGLVTIDNQRGPLTTITLNDDLEVRAGPVPYRTERGLDVLPIEAQIYYKRKVANPDAALIGYYNQLYQSYRGKGNPAPTTLDFYQTVPFAPRGKTGVDLGKEAIDNGSLWIALLARTADGKPAADAVARAREAIRGRVLSLGIVPWVNDSGRRLAPGGLARPEGVASLQIQIPSLPDKGLLDPDPAKRQANWRPLVITQVPVEPGVVEIPLPADTAALELWKNLDPLESGVRDFPPALDDTNQAERIITWLRVLPSNSSDMKLLWVGINATFVSQRAHLVGELLPTGNGEPDQAATLSRSPILPDTVSLAVTTGSAIEVWQQIDDLTSAGSEVSVPDLRLPPGLVQTNLRPTKVYTVDPEAGVIRFGDGTRGARPPLGAVLRVDYDYSVGPAGNVGPGSINTGPALPAGLKVTNPLPTWGGAAAESIGEGEKQIPRYLQHRDRLVNAADFETITLRTPGVAIGRVDVLSAFHPDLLPNEPGDAPGAVTLMLVPRYDPDHPDSPAPDQTFLDTVCAYLDPRRLVTTEVFLRGPDYQPIWVSVGIDVVAGISTAQTQAAVESALRQFLSPLPDPQNPTSGDLATLLAAPQYGGMQKGWPLRKAVVALELVAVASRVPGVQFVKQVLLAPDKGAGADQIKMSGLQLPRLAGLSVVVGDPVPLDQLQGQKPAILPAIPRVAVPVVPEECK